jgi:hypothetical protein
MTDGEGMFDGPPPDVNLFFQAEHFVAGALSTMAPFAEHHPAYALPYARRALEAMGEFVPTDAQGDTP